MINARSQFSQTKGYIIIMIAFLILLVNTGCSDDNPVVSEEDKLEGAEVVIKPQNASLETDEQLDFSAFVVTASGDTINEDLDITWEWYSSNPTIFTVQENGIATGQNQGEAYCIAEATIDTEESVAAKAIFVGRDSAFVSIFLN